MELFILHSQAGQVLCSLRMDIQCGSYYKCNTMKINVMLLLNNTCT